MKINQMYNVLNDINDQLFGVDVVQTNDLSGLVALGTTIGNAVSYDKWLGQLVDRIGKSIIRRLSLTTRYPNLYKDSYIFGAILSKVTIDPIQASNNSSWDIGNPGFTPTLFDINKPSISVKYFDTADTASFLVTVPFTQMESAFKNESEMTAFMNGIVEALQESIIHAIDACSQTAVNNFIAEKIKNANGVLHMLTMYNTAFPNATIATADEAITDPNFLRYTSAQIKLYREYLEQPSVLYNVAGKVRRTPKESQNILLLSEFATNSQVYLESDTFWKDLLSLPGYVSVPFWQGDHAASGDNEFVTNSTIDVIPSSEAGSGSPTAVTQSYVLGLIADEYAVAVGLNKRRSAAQSNNIDGYTNLKEEFTTQYINDLDENAIVILCD